MKPKLEVLTPFEITRLHRSMQQWKDERVGFWGALTCHRFAPVSEISPSRVGDLFENGQRLFRSADRSARSKLNAVLP